VYFIRADRGDGASLEGIPCGVSLEGIPYVLRSISFEQTACTLGYDADMTKGAEVCENGCTTIRPLV
jgi:hypothetical protein